jgi:hypothetical protein
MIAIVGVEGLSSDRRSEPSTMVKRWEASSLAVERRSVLRHLAVALTELARSPNISREAAARFAAAETRFRAILQTHDDIRQSSALSYPSVRLMSGASVSLVDLFSDACRCQCQRLSLGSIDPDLIDAAKELLCGLSWDLPGHGGDGVSSELKN